MYFKLKHFFLEVGRGVPKTQEANKTSIVQEACEITGTGRSASYRVAKATSLAF